MSNPKIITIAANSNNPLTVNRLGYGTMPPLAQVCRAAKCGKGYLCLLQLTVIIFIFKA